MLFLRTLSFFSIICFSFQAYSKRSCEENFAEPKALAPSRLEDFTELNKFASSMTEGLRLRRNQADLFNLYKQMYFSNPNQTVRKSFQTVMRILSTHPELSKLPVREQYIVFAEKLHDIPQSLIDFIKRFRNSASRVRNNLFRIYENLGFWRQVLSFPKPAIDPSLSKEEQKAVRKEEQDRFLEYLRQFIDAKVLEFIRDPTKNSKKKTVFMYKTLNKIREAMLADGKDIKYISQAMVDLIHTSGFGNSFYSDRLKSENPKERMEAIHRILDERDTVAMDLGFEDHFPELRQSLNVTHPTGSTKKENLSKVLREIEKDIERMPYTITKTSSVRVRPLSLQESSFRACLASSDCSSNTSFEKALDPSFLYFTMTDSNHKSSGHITIVLGTAENVKIGFVDKIQGVSNDMIFPMLESIRLSLHEQGYKLGLSEIDFYGISNTGVTSYYVQSEILPKLKVSYTRFKPHENGYAFSKGYSRAYSEPDLLEFQLPEDIDVLIEPGEIKQVQDAAKDLSVKTLFKEVLSPQNSEKEEDQIKFINNILLLEGIRGLDLSYPSKNLVSKYTRQFRMRKHNQDFIYNYLIQRVENPANSFKLRKLAFWTLTEFLYNLSQANNVGMTFLNIWNLFSEEEQNFLFSEMSNWRRANDSWKQNFITELAKQFSDGILSRDADFFLEHKLINLFVNFKDDYTKSAFLVATAREDIETVRLLVERDIGIRMSSLYAQYITALMIPANGSHSEGKNKLARVLLDFWDKFSEEEQNLLFNEISSWEKSQNLWKRGFIKELSKSFSDGLVSQDAKLFLKHKLIRLFTNFKDEFVEDAFMAATARGDIETVDFFLKQGFNIHFESKFHFRHLYTTALMIAVINDQTETVDFLLKRGADINKDFYGEPILFLAAKRGHTKTAELLIQRGVDIHHVDKRGETALMVAAAEGQTEMVDLLIQKDADIHHVAEYEPADGISRFAENGRTALSEAINNGHTKTAQLLMKRGAKRDNISPFRYYFKMIKAFIF